MVCHYQEVDGKAEAKGIEVNNDQKVISDITGLLWTIEEDKYLKAENETFLAYKGSGTDINLVETLMNGYFKNKMMEAII